MKLIHTADWQLGKPFSSFPAELATRLRQARLDAVERIAELARARGAGHVLVAGDVWDQETPAEATLRQPIEIMARAADLTWLLLPGNHDPARPNGLWARIARLGPPPNIRPLLTPEPVEIARNAVILPAPLTAKDPARDLTAWMDDAPTPDGALRIGLAHGPARSFGSTPDPAEIDAARAEKAGLAYLALGDWHGMREAGPRAWYSGAPEPDRFLENDPGWALEVTLPGPGAAPAVTPLRVARHVWREAVLELRPEAPIEAEIDALFDAETPRARTLLRLGVVGRARLADRARIDERLEALGAELAFLETDMGGLETVAETADLDAIEPSGAARLAAEMLLAESLDADADAGARADARRALEMLALWSRAADGSAQRLGASDGAR